MFYFCLTQEHTVKNKQVNLLENLNRTKTDSGNQVENTKMWNNVIEGTRQINSVTQGKREPFWWWHRIRRSDCLIKTQDSAKLKMKYRV